MTTTKKQGIRQGDISLIIIDKLPEGLTKSDSKVILQAGSSGNPHSFKGGVWYPKEERIPNNDKTIFQIGFLEARNTILLHLEHGKKKNKQGLKEAKIPNGIYQVIRQVETNENGEINFVQD